MRLLVSALTVLAYLAAAGGAGAFLLLLGRAVRAVVRVTDDFIGTPENPGVRDRLRSIEHELHPNGGTSMRDRLMQAIADVDTKADHARTAAGLAVNEAKAAREIVTEKLDQAAVERARVRADFAEHVTAVRGQELAYIRALRDIGIDLTHVTRELDPPEQP